MSNVRSSDELVPAFERNLRFRILLQKSVSVFRAMTLMAPHITFPIWEQAPWERRAAGSSNSFRRSWRGAGYHGYHGEKLPIFIDRGAGSFSREPWPLALSCCRFRSRAPGPPPFSSMNSTSGNSKARLTTATVAPPSRGAVPTVSSWSPWRSFHGLVSRQPSVLLR
jgi:hypothetical protein